MDYLFLEFAQQYGIRNDILRIPSPHTYVNTVEEKLSADMVKKIRQKEKAALEKISNLVKKRPIGGILIECIIGPFGVYFYRKEFLLELQKLCQQLKIYLIIDETLTCLRTGKFFSYEHYGLTPDFIIFGKGLGVCGIACGKHLAANNNFKSWNNSTIQGNAFSLLRSSLILKYVKQENLMEKIQITGKELIRRLQEKDELENRFEDEKSRGIGGLIFTKVSLPITIAYNRLLLPLTFTELEIDNLLNQSNDSFCFLCKTDNDVLLCCDRCTKSFHLECIGLKTVPETNRWYCCK